MDNGYFDLFAYKFRCWLGSVTRHIQNQQIKDYHYIGECGAKMTREEILKILKNIKNNVEHVDIHCKSQKGYNHLCHLQTPKRFIGLFRLQDLALTRD